jgi:hypothetical protein
MGSGRSDRWLPTPLLVGSLTLVMTAWPEAAIAQSFLAGDLNGDGQITAADSDLLRGYLQGSISLTDHQISAADVTGDGQITAADLDQLQQSKQVTVSAPNSQVTLDSAYSGQVIDRQTGQPLSNVEVAIPGAGISVRTDSQGRFQLPDNVPTDQILVAKLENYLPYSQTTTSQSGPLQVELDRWNQNATLVLETDVVHLGDDAYSANSAAANQFRLRTQGRELIRSFQLDRMPTSSPILRIGSLIGLDTPEAARAGQTRVAEADMSPLVVVLNGIQVQTIPLAGNNIEVPLPINQLRQGLNTVTLQTGKTFHPSFAGSGAQVPVNIPLFGGSLRIGIPVGKVPQSASQADYDDIELANVVIDLP